MKNCAFGYKKVDGRLEIDEPAAETVRMIFGLYSGGTSLAQVAARLYEDKRPTPGEYKRAVDNPSCIWGKSVILAILHDEQYIGTYTAGKTKKLYVGGNKVIDVDKSEWIMIPNHHPAIIDKTMFDAANEKINLRGEPLRRRKLGTSERYKDITSPLKGKIYCGCCGHTMKLSATRNAAFHCDFTRVAADVECYRLKMLASELEPVVFSHIRKQARAILKSAENSPAHSEPSTEQSARITEIEAAKCALYEKYINREISADEYKSIKAGLDADLERVRIIKAILTKETAKKASIDGFKQIAADAVKAKKLSHEFVDALIDKVRIYPGGKVEIAWIPQIGESAILY